MCWLGGRHRWQASSHSFCGEHNFVYDAAPCGSWLASDEASPTTLDLPETTSASSPHNKTPPRPLNQVQKAQSYPRRFLRFTQLLRCPSSELPVSCATPFARLAWFRCAC
jgi:hypothetical protein